VVEECGEPLLLPLPCGLPYAVERLGHMTRPSVRCVLCSIAFLLVPALGSTDSAAAAMLAPALFVGFTATTAVSDFSRSCIIGYGSSPSRCGPGQHAAPWLLADREISRFPNKKLLHMPGSVTTPDRPGARDGAPVRIAFHIRNCVGIRDEGFRGSMAGLRSPLPTLRRHPRGCLRTARGRCGSLLLHREGLAPSTPCRFRRRTPKPFTEPAVPEPTLAISGDP
jgi:hypothetical protein